MAQQFEPTSEASTRTQRITADESRAVIDLWQQERVEQTGLTDKPAVPDVAEGLDTTVEDVQRLLQDIRAKRLEEERKLATEQELSKICLAEEERKLAEVQRQRTELKREQAASARHRFDSWHAEVKPNTRLQTPLLKPRYLRERGPNERLVIRTQKGSDELSYLSSYFYAGIIIVFTFFVILSNVLK